MGTKEDCQRGEHTADNQGLCWWCGTVVEQDWYDHYTGKQPEPRMAIKRNADGQQNLRDLRKAVDRDPKISVFREGGNWIIAKFHDGVWHTQPCHYSHSERQVLQIALSGLAECPEKAKYQVKRSSK